MSDKNFKVKNKLTIAGLTNSSGVLLVEGHTVDSHTNLATQYGGTGTTTSPNSGQILYSSSGTTYAPTALTSLDVKGATYSADAPSNPVVGQIWVESDTSSDSFDPNIIRRKTFTATAAQTVFTTDVEFIQGYEQVFFNGMLLIRNSDYTTASNTNVTLAAGAAAGDIVEVVSITNLNSIDTYTQGEVDTALSAKLSTSTAASTYLTQSNAATTYVPQTSYSVAGKNAIINGGFDIWQRGTSISQSGTGGVSTNYTADRWVYGGSGGSAATISRQLTSDTTNLPHIQYCARFQRNSGNSDGSTIYFAQIFETANSIPFNGKTVTLSFYARSGANYSSTSSSLSVVLGSGTGTDQAFFAFTGTAGVAGNSVSLTSSWQRFTLTGTVASTATQLRLYFSYTPTGTAGSNDYFEVTGVQVEQGSVATSFSRAGGDIQGELAKCQRYYNRVNGTNVGGATWINGHCSGTSPIYAIACYHYPVEMRSAPTVTQSGSIRVSSASSLNDFSSFSGNASTKSLRTLYTPTGVTNGHSCHIDFLSTAYIEMSAEL